MILGEMDPRMAMLVAKLRAKKAVRPSPTPPSPARPSTAFPLAQAATQAQYTQPAASTPAATSPEVTRIVTSLPPEQYQQYSAFAAQQGVTLEQLVERLLAQQRAQPQQPPAPQAQESPPDFYDQH